MADPLSPDPFATGPRSPQTSTSDVGRSESGDSFKLNRPSIVALLYLASLLTGLTLLIGVILAYIWLGEPHAAWEETHYRYHIRTFWLSLVYAIIGCILLFVGIGFLILALIGVWVAIRSIKSLLLAQRGEPVAAVETWLW